MIHYLLDWQDKQKRDRIFSEGTEAEKKQAFDNFVSGWRSTFIKNMLLYLFKIRGKGVSREEVAELFHDTALDFWYYISKNNYVIKNAEALFWTMAKRREQLQYARQKKMKYSEKNVEELDVKYTFNPEAQDIAEKLWHYIQTMSGACPELLRYFYAEGLTQSEIGKLMDKSEGYVSQTLYRCREKLRDTLTTFYSNLRD